MNLNESIVEDAALILPGATLARPLPRGEEWELDYAVGHGPAIPEEVRATIRNFRVVRFPTRRRPNP